MITTLSKRKILPMNSLPCHFALKKYTYDDFSKYVYYNNNKYNRITLHKNKHCEIVLICWNKDQESKIHDYQGKTCVMKILSGELLEECY